MTWTPEKLARLAELWAQGLSMSLVAQALSFEKASGEPREKVTRSMVAGMLKRRGLTREETRPREQLPFHPACRAKAKRRWEPTIPRTVLSRPPKLEKPVIKPEGRPWMAKVVEVEANGVPTDIISIGPSGCRWAVDMRDGAHLFCNRKVIDGPYCPEHAERGVTRQWKARDLHWPKLAAE